MKLILLGIILFIGLISHAQTDTIIVLKSMLYSEQFDSLTLLKNYVDSKSEKDAITRQQLSLLDSLRIGSNLIRRYYFDRKDSIGLSRTMDYQIYLIRKHIELINSITFPRKSS